MSGSNVVVVSAMSWPALGGCGQDVSRIMITFALPASLLYSTLLHATSPRSCTTKPGPSPLPQSRPAHAEKAVRVIASRSAAEIVVAPSRWMLKPTHPPFQPKGVTPRIEIGAVTRLGASVATRGGKTVSGCLAREGKASHQERHHERALHRLGSYRSSVDRGAAFSMSSLSRGAARRFTRRVGAESTTQSATGLLSFFESTAAMVGRRCSPVFVATQAPSVLGSKCQAVRSAAIQICRAAR